MRPTKHYLVVSDFDRTLSLTDSGDELCKLLGISDFDSKVAGLARQNFVQGGAELTYLLRHDPEFRCVRRGQLVEAGYRVVLKHNVRAFAQLLESIDSDCRFDLRVISAAPREIVEAALEGIVPSEHIFGTELVYDAAGEIQGIEHCAGGYGKVALLDALRDKLEVNPRRIFYIGDGSSDIHVMLHLERLGGLTIAASENRHIQRVARRTLLSDDALGFVVPLLEEALGWSAEQIDEELERRGFVIQAWDRMRADALVIRAGDSFEKRMAVGR